jgi:hypothetical protein
MRNTDFWALHLLFRDRRKMHAGTWNIHPAGQRGGFCRLSFDTGSVVKAAWWLSCQSLGGQGFAECRTPDWGSRQALPSHRLVQGLYRVCLRPSSSASVWLSPEWEEQAYLLPGIGPGEGIIQNPAQSVQQGGDSYSPRSSANLAEAITTPITLRRQVSSRRQANAGSDSCSYCYHC